MATKYATLFDWVIAILEYSILNIAFYICLIMIGPYTSWYHLPLNFQLYIILMNLYWFFCSAQLKLYKQVLQRRTIGLMQDVAGALTLFAAGSFTITTILPQSAVSVTLLFNTSFLFILFVSLGRILFVAIRISKRNPWFEQHKILIVGASRVGQDFHQCVINKYAEFGHQVVGFFDDNIKSSNSTCVPILGRTKDCIDYALANQISEIYCALPIREICKIKKLRQAADKHFIRFKLIPDLKEYLDSSVLIDLFDHFPVLAFRKEPLHNKINEITKRVFDILFSAIVIVFLLSWLVPMIAILIKLDSKGPVLFRQLRSGKNNKPFYCYKFRSMAVNADSDTKQAIKGDPRVTRIGAILRKTNFDELPQFFNVLMGEMSVVGPRPHMLKHTQEYSQLIGNFMVRHFLTPGITGWAQVNGLRGETKEADLMSKRVEADIWYLENWSLLLDLKIIVLTIWLTLKGSENAY